jgi:hypothetical protein
MYANKHIIHLPAPPPTSWYQRLANLDNNIQNYFEAI